MKDVTFDKGISSDDRLLSLAKESTNALEEVLGVSAGLVRAHWGVETDAKGRTLVTLRLSNFTGEEVEARFEPAELANALHRQTRLYRLWGDLLQVRLDRQLQRLKEPVDGGVKS